MNEIDQIHSYKIRKISSHLLELGCKITYFGVAWSKIDSNWIYFDTELKIEELIALFDIDGKLKIHENTDPRSGLEKGLIDEETGEAIMGTIKDHI